MAPDAHPNPYVGPRPFEREDAPRFFGRAREVRDVVSLIVAQRVVLLYAASGAGKSSLLNAGVVPVLEEKGFDVLPIARVRPDRPPAVGNVFVSGLLSSVSDGAAGGSSLVDVIAARREDRHGGLRALVIDQFEELFTAYPERWQERGSFFEQLQAALDSDSGLRIVLAIREDFLAQLDPFASALSGGLRTRFRLERLDRTCALAAVQSPVSGTGRAYAPGVAEALVTELLRFRVKTIDGVPVEVEGEFVEPVQLQVTCRSLWDELPPEVEEITEEHLRIFGNVDEVLAQFYDESVHAAATAAQMRERLLRSLIEQEFITSVGTRGTAYRTQLTTGNIPNAAIDELESRHVVRAEARAFARWYELTHDRLIEPIRASNARYFAALAGRRTRRAVWIGAAAFAAAVAAGLTLWATATGSVRTANLSPPTLQNSGSRSFTVQTQVSGGSRRARQLSVRFSEQSAERGARTAISALSVKVPPRGPVSVSLPIPTGTNQFSVRAELIDNRGHVLDSADSGRWSVQGARVRAPSQTYVSFAVTVSGGGSVTSAPKGIHCPTTCSAAYSLGQRVVLTAVPGAAARFAGWRGPCAGTSTCTVNVSRVTTIAASFAELGVRPISSPPCGRIEYGGRGPVDVIIASDLPLSGPRAREMTAAAGAIRSTIAASHWRAGHVSVAYQSCDSGAGKSQLSRCKRNAEAYAADPNLVAVIGAVEVDCARAELPVLARSGARPVAVVSPGIAELCLTVPSRLCSRAPAFGSGPSPNLVRVSPSAATQAVALAEFAQRRGSTCAAVIDDGTHTGAMLAFLFNIATRQLGIFCGPGAWANSGVMKILRDEHADAVVAAGQPGPSAARIIREKVAAPGTGGMKLIVPGEVATPAVLAKAGASANGMIVGSISSPAPAYAAQAADLVLAAIAKGGRDRTVVLRALRTGKVRNGIVGSFRIDEHGDPVPLVANGTSTLVPLGIQMSVVSGGRLERLAVLKPLECLVRFVATAPSDTARAPQKCVRAALRSRH